jgi:SAM-dependent methyltransferase
MVRPTTAHYDAKYFDWQSSIGEFGGWANLTKFAKYVRPEFNVIDFGCGGGYLLRNLQCRGKIGIEVSEVARQKARDNGIQTVASAEPIDDQWADLIISNNALEHVTQPLAELQRLRPKLKRDGRIVFVVPCETIRYKYRPRDINHHLYSWSPMCLGNLFTDAGFVVDESVPYIRKWPKRYRAIARFGGRALFELCCWLYAHWERTWFQVRIVAHRE